MTTKNPKTNQTKKLEFYTPHLLGRSFKIRNEVTSPTQGRQGNAMLRSVQRPEFQPWIPYILTTGLSNLLTPFGPQFPHL